MSDVFTKQKRSEVMSRIKGKGNKDTELTLVQILRKFHISGWRRNQKIFGKPDFAFLKQKTLVFVDGCFWHCCPLHSSIPKSNMEFWQKKLLSNVTRDRHVTKVLRKKGWKVIRIWEHELINSERVAKRIIKALQ